MAGLSDYAEKKILDHALGTTSWTMPAQIYAALYTAAPTDAGGGTEVSTGGGSLYARQAVDFDAASGGATDLTADCTFPQAGTNWGTISYLGLHDAVTAGNLIAWGVLASTKVIETGDTFKILAADLDVTIE